MNTPNTITIPLDEYHTLKRASFLLEALHDWGVAHWEYYEDAVDDADFD